MLVEISTYRLQAFTGSQFWVLPDDFTRTHSPCVSATLISVPLNKLMPVAKSRPGPLLTATEGAIHNTFGLCLFPEIVRLPNDKPLINSKATTITAT